MFDIIIIAMIAAFILLRLRAELGNKTGNEPLPGQRGDDRFSARNRGERSSQSPEESDFAADTIEGNVVDITANPEVREGLAEIRRADSRFDTHAFLEGARRAYGMILKAFWDGDRETLETFVAPSVLSQFMSAIDAREEAGETVESRVVEISEAEISAAKVVSSNAEIRVDFTAELISLTRDKDGNVIDGDMSDTVTSRDRWTFSRPIKTRDPNWLLVATRSI